MLEKLFGLFSKKQFSSIESSALNLQKESISHPALTIIRKLKRSGWDAFIVGGAVRDSHMGVKSCVRDGVDVGSSPEDMGSNGVRQIR